MGTKYQIELFNTEGQIVMTLAPTLSQDPTVLHRLADRLIGVRHANGSNDRVTHARVKRVEAIAERDQFTVDWNGLDEEATGPIREFRAGRRTFVRRTVRGQRGRAVPVYLDAEEAGVPPLHNPQNVAKAMDTAVAQGAQYQRSLVLVSGKVLTALAANAAPKLPHTIQRIADRFADGRTKYGLEHDQEHGADKLVMAARAILSGNRKRWPFSGDVFRWIKNRDDSAQLVHAAGLLAAAIEVLDTPKLSAADLAGVPLQSPSPHVKLWEGVDWGEPPK